MEHCCQKYIGKCIILKWGHRSFRGKGKSHFLNITFFYFILLLPSSFRGKVVWNRFHAVYYFEIISAFMRYTHSAPISIIHAPTNQTQTAPPTYPQSTTTNTTIKKHPFPDSQSRLISLVYYWSHSIKRNYKSPFKLIFGPEFMSYRKLLPTPRNSELHLYIFL